MKKREINNSIKSKKNLTLYNMKAIRFRKKLAGLLVCSIFLQTSAVASAQEVLLFSNEIGEENGNTLILDFDDTGGDVRLQFGSSLNEALIWNDANGRFEFTDDILTEGNLEVDGQITTGSGDITITTVTGQVDGEQIADDTIDEDSIDFGTGAGQVGGDDIVLVDTFDNSAGTDVQTVADDIDAAIGDRLYTEDNFITDGSTITNALDILDQQVQDNFDAITTPNITGTDNNTFTIDADDTGGNVDLIFGTAVGAFIRHDGTLFTVSDDLLMDGASTIQFRDSALNIGSSVDGQLDIDADTEVEITAPTVDLNGDLDVSGTINGTTLGTTGLTFGAGATVGDAANTLALDSLNWSIDVSGTTTGLVIDADVNTITNIGNDEIAADANIDFSKLATREKKIFIGMNDLTLESDGSSNQVNVYTESESGPDPHQFYTVRTNQGGLNDIDLKFKVKLPDDFVDFSGTNDIQFSYRNTGADNTDSKIDILVEDDEGDAAFTVGDGQDLFSTVWNDFFDEFDGGAFDPAAGEYVYVTVKGYASKDGPTFQEPNIGEIVLNYVGR